MDNSTQKPIKQYLHGVAIQATAIILAALGAAAISFFQSISLQTGACNPINPSSSEAGALGAILKSAHTAFIYFNGKAHL